MQARVEWTELSDDAPDLCEWTLKLIPDTSALSPRSLYLGRDVDFVVRVLGRNFREFIGEAMFCAGWPDHERAEALRTMLGAMIVDALGEKGLDQDALMAIQPWELCPD